MLKNILVVLEDNAAALIPYSVSAARRLGARVTVIRPRRDASGLEDGSLQARLEVASGGAEMHKARARETLEAFAAAAEDLDVEVLMPGQDPSRDMTPVFARCFDFVLVQQTEPGRPPASDDLIGELLSESGRPVLVVPAIQRRPASFKRVVVAWDGGRGRGALVRRRPDDPGTGGTRRDRFHRGRPHAAHRGSGRRTAGRATATRRRPRRFPGACRRATIPPTPCCPMSPTSARI